MSFEKRTAFILAGDIGGTKTNLGLFSCGATQPIRKSIESFSSRDESGLEDIIRKFLEKHDVYIENACFGVAGPVIDGRSKITNLHWTISENRITRIFKWKFVRVLNDLEAMAYGIPNLTERGLYTLHDGKKMKGYNFGLIAPGTGLGEVLGVWSHDRHIIIPSEGGHADFSPNSSDQAELWGYLNKRYGHVSIERVLSGQGLLNIYSWLKESGRYQEPKWLSMEMKVADPARTISMAAIEKRAPICAKALDIFVSVFGSMAGNLALTGMTRGGIYLGGGISPKILPKLKDGTFFKAFVDKGRFSGMLEEVSVKVLLDENVPLLGAASCAFEKITMREEERIMR